MSSAQPTGAWRDLDLAVVDVETTGLDPDTDRVIEIGVVHMRAGEVIDVYQSLVNPQRDLPEEVERITGIKAADVETAPTFAEVAANVRAALQGKVFVAYNLAFDRAFVRGELERCGFEWHDPRYIDPLIFVRELHKNQGSKRLGAVAARLGISLDNAHRAADDAEAAGHVLYALAGQLPQDLDDLIMLQSQWEAQHANEMASWRNKRESRFDGVGAYDAADRGNALGPAYIYGEDTDPIRAMFTHLPDSGSRR